MFRKIKQFFTKKRLKNIEPVELSESLPLLEIDTGIQWLEKEDSPFGISGVDCFKFTQSMRSVTSDENIMAKFLTLRSYNGKDLKGKLPNDFISVDTSLKYPYLGEVRDGILVKARQMENKWDIYLFDKRIYFCRSWTGELAFVVDFNFDGETVSISKIYAWADSLKDAEGYIVSQVDYLIKHYLHGKIVPHPIPQKFPLDLEQIALLSQSNYGMDCCFATYEDTVNYKRSEHGLSDR